MKPIPLTHARMIAREFGDGLPPAGFYRENEPAVSRSREIYHTNAMVRRFRDYLGQKTDNFGHGLAHSELVAQDAGAIVLLEMGQDHPEIETIIVVVQTAGLLHDIKRKEPNHADKSADEAAAILAPGDFDESHRKMIVEAIRNHEAFRQQVPIDNFTGRLVSDALYDADKFRWGPDNFITTLWDMLEYARIDVESMLSRYTRSIEGIKRIKETFRTPTGKRYGPEFIDLGLSLGEAIYGRLTALMEEDG